MKHSATIIVPLALALVAGIAGCQGTTAQGTLYSVQIDRELEAFLAGDLETVHLAAVAVLDQDLGYTIQESAVDAMEGVVAARTARDHLVRVETFKQGEGITRVEVFAGPSGNEVAARRVLDHLEQRLAGQGTSK